MTGSFKHHFPDVLPQRAPDVSGIIERGAAAEISGPHVAVRVWNSATVSSRLSHTLIAVVAIDGDALR